ncbi:MAG: hypothetical protein EOR84_25635 [Mesorhizobium sp.]|uniref:hypothetical protein n=1 Tax=Mesorhizobium sp. TaxID=1871066 RepID=UPI000FE47177|nr:hypothetical protein [Mesorhizobium sp.]RWM88950.1 MAG: hypothetical protein EOR84_25635 [Mesorhizobium sp.]
MPEREEIVAAIVDAAGGELVSRIRLQKIAYLLDQLGLESNFEYQYFHYGPYSRDLDNAVADAEAFNLIEEHFGSRKSDGARYSIFHLKTKPTHSSFGKIDDDRARRLAQTFSKTNVTVLELAATVHWLCFKENRKDWSAEIVKRKGAKTRDGRLEKAIELLASLELAPQAHTVGKS